MVAQLDTNHTDTVLPASKIPDVKGIPFVGSTFEMAKDLSLIHI